MDEPAPGDWRKEVLRFWFRLEPGQWWKSDEQLDRRSRERFKPLWEEKRERPISEFLLDPLTALAAVILLDQFPRNIFRGHADQYASDHVAIAVAKGAVERGFDDDLAPVERGFLYMPFQHSEDRKVQARSIELFTQLDDPENLGYARKHQEIIDRFGRFPHRNEVLGRVSTPEEAQFVATHRGF